MPNIVTAKGGPTMHKLSQQHLRESNLIEGIDDPAADAQAWVAWGYLSKQRKLTSPAIKRAHELLMQRQPYKTTHRTLGGVLQPQHVGKWRNIQVYVGDHVPPHYRELDSKMRQWVATYKYKTPKEAHVEFETIHPFVDGNGRIGRMLMWWQEINNGEEPTLLLADERAEYYKWFKRQTNPYSPIDIFKGMKDL